MPTTSNKNKTTTRSGAKNTGTKNSKSGTGVANAVHIPTARERAKDMDSKRRGDTETFNI